MKWKKKIYETGCSFALGVAPIYHLCLSILWPWKVNQPISEEGSLISNSKQYNVLQIAIHVALSGLNLWKLHYPMTYMGTAGGWGGGGAPPRRRKFWLTRHTKKTGGGRPGGWFSAAEGGRKFFYPPWVGNFLPNHPPGEKILANFY